jgi:hypothetical protein
MTEVLYITCTRCEGSGEYPPGTVCSRCGGSGQYPAGRDDCLHYKIELIQDGVGELDISSLVDKLDDLKSKAKDRFDDIDDKLNDIMDKCNDIFEQVSE